VDAAAAEAVLESCVHETAVDSAGDRLEQDRADIGQQRVVGVTCLGGRDALNTLRGGRATFLLTGVDFLLHLSQVGRFAFIKSNSQHGTAAVCLRKFCGRYTVGGQIFDQYGIVVDRIESEVVPESAVAGTALGGEDAGAGVGGAACVAPVAE